MKTPIRNFKPTIDVLICSIIFLVLQFIALKWLLFPVLDYDEGGYIMAARRMLEGDWFLQHHSFDKPFLHPLLLALSAVIFGQHFVGFRMIGWILFSLSFWIFSLSLNRLFRQRTLSRWGQAIDSVSHTNSTIPDMPDFLSWPLYGVKWLLLVGIFLNPVMIVHGASSMAEPLLQFLLTLILLFYPFEIVGSRVLVFLNTMGTAFWLKGSILIWSPLMLVFSLRRLFQNLKTHWKAILKPLLIISAIGLWYGMVGKTKFIVFRFLFYILTVNDGIVPEKTSFFSPLISWLEIIKNSFGISFLGILFLLAMTAIALLVAEFRQHCSAINDKSNNRSKQSVFAFFNLWICRHLIANLLVIGLFFFVVLGTKVGLAPRYFLVVTPMIFFFLGLQAVLLLQKAQTGKWAKAAAQGYLLVTCLLVGSLPFQLQGWTPGTYNGIAKLSTSILSETPVNATLINRLVWPLAAYVPSDLVVVETATNLNLNRHQTNNPSQPAAFAFSGDVFFESFQHLSKNLSTDAKLFCPGIQELREPLQLISESEFKLAFLQSIKAVGNLDWLKLEFKPRAFSAPDDFLSKFPLVFRESHAGVEVQATLRGHDKVLGALPTIKVKGVLVLYRGRSLNKFWHSDSWALGLRLEEVDWQEKQMDLIPFVLIAKEGLTLPLIPLNVVGDDLRPNKIELSQQNSESQLSISQIQYLKSCSSKAFGGI